MRYGLLFPGQGTQHGAMLPWLETCPEAAPLLSTLAGLPGCADWRRRLTDEPAWARANAVAQPLLVGTSLAAWAALAPRLPAPQVIAGYSVGELSAVAAAGGLDAHAALRLAVARAAIMDATMAATAGGEETGLLSISGLAPAALAACCEQRQLAIAIRLAPDRAIVGGPVGRLAAAEVQAVAAGAACQRLAVSIASHTPWLAGAVAPLQAAIEASAPQAPQRLLVMNFTAGPVRSAAALSSALAAQVAATVRWDECMGALAERDLDCVLEVGPGTSLSRLWQQRHPAVPARSLDDFRQPEAAAAWVRRQART